MRGLLTSLLVATAVVANAQDIRYVRYVVDSLCSERMAGRGYVEGGLDHAAAFIARQFDSLGVETLNGARFQSFTQSVNTFPDSSAVVIDDVELVPGRDYLIDPNSPTYSGTLPMQHVDSALIQRADRLTMLPGVGFVLHPVSAENYDLNILRTGLLERLTQRGPVINPVSNLTWSVGEEHFRFPIIEVLDSVVDWSKLKTAQFDIQAEINPAFEAQNVLGVVPAKRKKQREEGTYIVFTAHYDHLGKMGQAMFPGANDNASGVATMLDLARYYSEHPASYNVLFLAFAGEEAGLVGSKHFVDNSLVPLDKIEFLINLDLMGNGEDGVTVVNGKLFEDDFKQLAEINKKEGYLEKVRIRGAAANSDHYWFSENGVPAFFIYTLGDRKAYHDIYDVPETLEFKGYEGLFRLVTEFVEER